MNQIVSQQKPVLEAQAEKPKPVYINEAFSSFQGLKKFLKYKFSADQWFGSVIMGLCFYINFEGMRASLIRQAVDKDSEHDDLSKTKNEKNIPQLLACITSGITNIWTFLSSRSAIPPEGNSYKERIINALKHPERSHEQAKHVIYLPNSIIVLWGHARLGFGSKGQPEERLSRRVITVTVAISLITTIFDFFGNKRKIAEKKLKENIKVVEPSPVKNSSISDEGTLKSIKDKLLYPFRVLTDQFKSNPSKMISMGLSIITSLAFLYEGYVKQKVMLHRLILAGKEGSKQWENMRDSLESEISSRQELDNLTNYEGLSRNQAITRLINDQRQEKLAESKSLIRKGFAGLLIPIASNFYTLDQMHKGEKVMQEEMRRKLSSTKGMSR